MEANDALDFCSKLEMYDLPLHLFYLNLIDETSNELRKSLCASVKYDFDKIYCNKSGSLRTNHVVVVHDGWFLNVLYL